MCTKEPIADESTDNDLEPRSVRALTECISVLGRVGRVKDADDLFLVVSESGSEYLVDARDGVCECPDHEHRGAHCKHIRAAEFATGVRPIPAWVNREAINNTLGAHVDAEPQFGERKEGEPVTVADTKPTRAVRVATDGGQVLEELDENESETGATADVDPLEVNRTATEAVAGAGGRLADFDVFCVTVEATQDTLLRTAQAEN